MDPTHHLLGKIKLREINVNIVSSTPGTSLAPVEVELLAWNQIWVHLGCDLLCAAHTTLWHFGGLEGPEIGAQHSLEMMLTPAASTDPVPCLSLGE